MVAMHEMELIGVRVEMPTNAPMVLLRERGGSGRTVPIYIGAPEATAIALALDGVDTPRPMTHDLLRDILEELAVDVERRARPRIDGAGPASVFAATTFTLTAWTVVGVAPRFVKAYVSTLPFVVLDT